MLRFLVDMRGADVDDRQVNCENKAFCEFYVMLPLSSYMQQTKFINSWLVTASG